MTTPLPAAYAPQTRLRLWPGIVLVALQFLFRVGVKALVPGIKGFGWAVMGSLACTVLLIVWLAFFSRSRRLERFGALGLMALALGGTWLLRHESMSLAWLLAYAVPGLCLAFVLWAVATQRLANRVRLATMIATIVVACSAWLALRQDGINGDHVATFGWRWSKSPEERLLAETASQPTVPQTEATPIASPTVSTTASPSPTPIKNDANKSTPANSTPEWPGFRGPRRDGVARGVKIKTDWAATPPMKLWSRPIGPGWSSFAVNGDLIYTQEQRGESEVVACYKASTGQPVWAHSDAARFFESNAGAGPRGTPTLANGRVYTLGATGILNALDAAKGTPIWSHNIGTDTGKEVPFWGFSSSPLVLGDVVIVAASGQLVGYDATTGNRRWLGPSSGGSYSSPQLVTIAGMQQVLLVTGTSVTSVDPTNGQKIWDHAWEGNSIVQPAMTADGDVLLTSQDRGTQRIAVQHNSNGWSVEERWTSNALKPYFNDFVLHKGYAYGFDGRILSCLDLKDGQRKWKGGRYGNGQLVLLPDQDLLLVLSEEGELVLVSARPDQFTEIAKVPAIEGKTWNHPVVVGDLLLVRNGEQMAGFRLSRAE
jgi:outer membrane protein assembly factor BamB